MATLPTIAILGTGSMGGAILSGLLGPDVSVTGGIRVTNRTQSKADALASSTVTSYALESTPDANIQAVAGASIVLLGVKPYMIADLLTEIAPHLEPDAIVISVAAGVTIATMEALTSNVVLRAMPNTPAVVGLAVTGISAGARGGEADAALARQLFETVGTVLEVPETKINALSTISGSGPAYVFYLIEELTRTAVDLGFTPEEAAVMVNGTFRGASELLAGSDVGPEELRRRVTSPNGTTERAVAVLQDAGLKETFDRATAAALRAIHADPARVWRLSDLANEAGLSRASFAERFRARVGVAPIEYATRWRMRIAARRLLDGRRSASAVAQELGFLSDSAFGAAFRRVHGVTPGRYRSMRKSAEASTVGSQSHTEVHQVASQTF